MVILAESGLNNVLYDQSTVQLLYNIIHWILGANLIAFAILEYKKNRAKNPSKKANLIGPAVFAFNGLFFVAFVLLGHVLYLQLMGLPWQFSHEHVIHIAIGAVLAVGGTLELLYRLKRLRHLFWHYALPLSLIAGGLGFLHPQHGLGDVLEYMTIFHRILASCLILSGVSLGVAWLLKKEKKIIYGSLALIALSGAVFIGYRHQYNTEAACNATNATIHEIRIADGKAEPQTIETELCDKLRFISDDNEHHVMTFGGHSHHSSYPGFKEESQDEIGDFQEITLSLSGTFYFHDHLNQNLNGYVTIDRPRDLSGWDILKL
jgi:plastocyanin